jgi:hypothetical protein
VSGIPAFQLLPIAERFLTRFVQPGARRVIHLCALSSKGAACALKNQIIASPFSILRRSLPA